MHLLFLFLGCLGLIMFMNKLTEGANAVIQIKNAAQEREDAQRRRELAEYWATQPPRPLSPREREQAILAKLSWWEKLSGTWNKDGTFSVPNGLFSSRKIDA